MHHYTIEQQPLRIQALGTTRAGLILATVNGFFDAAGAIAVLEGEEAKRSFEIQTESAPELILAVIRMAASSAAAHQEVYSDISFSLITDKKAVGSFIGRPAKAPSAFPAIHGIDGEVVKDADGVWRATIALGDR